MLWFTATDRGGGGRKWVSMGGGKWAVGVAALIMTTRLWPHQNGSQSPALKVALRALS